MDALHTHMALLLLVALRFQCAPRMDSDGKAAEGHTGCQAQDHTRKDRPRSIKPSMALKAPVYGPKERSGKGHQPSGWHCLLGCGAATTK